MAGTDRTTSGAPDPYDVETVAGYDALNPDGPDHDYFRSLADGARRISDLGCGTGILTVTLAAPGRTVTGIHPSARMLGYAAARPGGDAVDWRLGTSERLPAERDLVIMSGNVAMHIVGEAWATTLTDIRRSLRPGGRVAFETRNPDAEAWRGWNEPAVLVTRGGRPVRESLTTEPPEADGVVVMRSERLDVESGEWSVSEQRLQFRTLAQIEADLQRAGLRVEHVWQCWDRQPPDGTTIPPLFVIEASAPGSARPEAGVRTFGVMEFAVPDDFDGLPEDELQLWE